MIKIKSITDIITNSSTEVFIFDTDLPLNEVAAYLKGATYGYDGPEILTLDNGGGKVMKAMLEYGSFVDVDDIRSLETYWYYQIIDGLDYKYGKKRNNETWKKLNLEWRKYLIEHRDLANSREDGITVVSDKATVESVHVFQPLLPEGFVKSFIEQYQGPLPSPTCWEIPKDMIAKNYVGKIGIVSWGDNTIPYDTWYDINAELKGRNWHLG